MDWNNKMYSDIERCLIIIAFVGIFLRQIEFAMLVFGIYIVFLFGVCIEVVIKGNRRA